ncbi:MAG: DUF2207 domain-containing protein [bacterium]
MVKRNFQVKVFLFIFLIALFIGSFALAQEKINSYDVQAQIQKNSSVLITEDIFYDFGTEYRHGIYRDIYTKDINVDVKSVVDENGNKYKYDLSKTGDNIRVKIGDANQTITGEHQYIITYLVKGAVKFLPDHDEFYWNVTGNNWPVPIEGVLININFPQVEDFLGEKNLKCYVGQFGSTREDCQYSFDGTAHFRTTRLLDEGEGLTVVFGWPKGVVSPPSTIEKITDSAKKYWPLIIPVLMFVYLFSVWWKKGRDIKLHRSIMVQYDLPNELRPIEVSYILKQKTTYIDLSATIIDLAVKGYIKIKETEQKKFIGKTKDWTFIKQKDYVMDKTLEPFEWTLLSKLFVQKSEVAVSSLRQKFYEEFKEIKENVSTEMVLDDYFVSDPEKAKSTFIGIGMGLLIGSFILIKVLSIFIPFVRNLNGWYAFIIITCAFLFIIFGALMPKKSKKGTEMMWHILGFKEYITRAEKYRAQFQEKENIFEKFLPYAIIFGCTKKWAKAFEGIYKTPPTWYEGAVYGTYFSPVNFSESLNKSLAGIGGALASQPGGGKDGSGFSGGFSGGGFGGGGGGSW